MLRKTPGLHTLPLSRTLQTTRHTQYNFEVLRMQTKDEVSPKAETAVSSVGRAGVFSSRSVSAGFSLAGAGISPYTGPCAVSFPCPTCVAVDRLGGAVGGCVGVRACGSGGACVGALAPAACDAASLPLSDEFPVSVSSELDSCLGTAHHGRLQTKWWNTRDWRRSSSSPIDLSPVVAEEGGNLWATGSMHESRGQHCADSSDAACRSRSWLYLGVSEQFDRVTWTRTESCRSPWLAKCEWHWKVGSVWVLKGGTRFCTCWGALCQGDFMTPPGPRQGTSALVHTLMRGKQLM